MSQWRRPVARWFVLSAALVVGFGCATAGRDATGGVSEPAPSPGVVGGAGPSDVDATGTPRRPDVTARPETGNPAADVTGATTAPPPTEGSAAVESGATDVAFVRQAASGGIAEVQAADLALERAASPEVRALAQHIQNDHRQANEELERVSAAAGITASKVLLPEHRQRVERLSGLGGDEFDREFLRAMMTSHEQAVRLFENQAREGTLPELRAFAQRTVPILEEHLSHVRTLHAQIEAARGGQRVEERGDRP